MSTLGKSPSDWRVVVIAGAFAVLTSAMTPDRAAAANHPKASTVKKPAETTAPPRPQTRGGGGPAGPLSLEWRAAEALRP